MANSIHGKTELSLRRKKSNTPASQTPTISSDLKFAHQLNAGETTIPLNALVLPTQMPAFVNPSATEIANANVKANASNLILVSSLKGTLMCDLSYKVISNTQINLEFEAEANEIIIGHFRATRGTDQLLEGRLWSVSGTLTAGNTDFALGQSFKTNANSNYQIGEVIVFVDGVQQYRNVDNATAAPAADGNYEEVDAGGVFNLIRFNDVYPVDVAVTVVPSSYIVTTSDLALQPQLDALAGQVDQMIPTLAAIAGVPETEFQGQPNNVDLKSFGDKVQQNRNDIESNDADILDLQNNKKDNFEVKYQFKEEPNNVQVSANLASLTFNNLEIGKKYRISGMVTSVSISGTQFQFNYNNGANLIVSCRFEGNDNVFDQATLGFEAIFTATATVLQASTVAGVNAYLIGGAGRRNFAQLEELPNHEETSDWT